MLKVLGVGALVCSLGLAVNAHAAQYTLILKNGDDPNCNITTGGGSRVVLGSQYQPIQLSSFTEDNGTYTYTWEYSRPDTVAIQVQLAGFRVPDVWGDRNCVYAPVFDANLNHVTFTQQYIRMASKYTCTCTSTWDTE